MVLKPNTAPQIRATWQCSECNARMPAGTDLMSACLPLHRPCALRIRTESLHMHMPSEVVYTHLSLLPTAPKKRFEGHLYPEPSENQGLSGRTLVRTQLH